MFKNILLLIVLLSSYMFSSSLQEDIALLKSTPKDKRYILMNKIKLRLSKMNANQRALAMQNLFKTIHPNKTHQQSSKMMKKAHKNHQTKEMLRVKNNQEHFEKKNGKTISRKEKKRPKRHRGNH